MPYTVRTTINPDVEVEVSDAEYTDLRRNGLLLVEEAPVVEAPAPAAAPSRPAPRAAAAAVTPADKEN